MSNELSSKMRAYMAEIYRLVDRQPNKSENITSSQLADGLFVSPPAVNRMVNRLSELGLLLHQPYQGITITDPDPNQLKRSKFTIWSTPPWIFSASSPIPLSRTRVSGFASWNNN